MHQANICGWCTKEKGAQMMDLILEIQPDVCVEVGVFGGASVYPTASTLKFLKKGKIFAIDPWSNPECLEGYGPEDSNYQWWSTVDLENVYQGFMKMLSRFKLHSYCSVMRMTAKEALQYFDDESIDILHIDGNHTEDSSLSDAKMYLPKVKKGGYIWFDDANWNSTRQAWKFLTIFCEKDEMRSTSEYFLFKKK